MPSNFAIFISNYGRAAIEIINHYKDGDVKPVLKLILSDNPKSFALQWAEKHGVATAVVERKNFADKPSFEKTILDILQSHQIEFIFLSGYTNIIGNTLLTAFNNRILNVHPSLLPSFPGLYAIDQALNFGAKVTGVTIHYVNENIDTGPVLLQEAVAIEPGDNFEILDKKIFQVGVRLMIQAINKVF